VVDDILHPAVIGLNTRHGHASMSAMRHSMAQVYDAIDCIFVLVNEVGLKIALPVCVEASD